MNTVLIIFLLWVPFILYASIYGTIYSVRGYKKGLYRSLISVGATGVAGVISAILAKFFAARIADDAYNAIMSEGIDASSPFVADLVALFAKGALQGFMALFLFSSILFWATIIVKVIASAIVKNRFEPQNKSMRWAGMGVRLVEAIVFSLLLLLPLYGTLATYMPIAEDVIAMTTTTDSESDDLTVLEIIGEINNHPLLKAVRTKPITVIYNALSESNLESSSINLPEIVSSVSGILEQLKGIKNIPEEERVAAIQSLIQYLESDVVNQEWVYDVYLLAKNEIVKMYNESTSDMTAEERRVADELIKSLDMPKKDFQAGVKESLRFTEYLIESDFMDKLENEGESVFDDDEFLYSLGEWLNCSDSMLAIKKTLVLTALNSVTEDIDASMKIISELDLKIHTDKEEQKNEAKEILKIIFENLMNETSNIDSAAESAPIS
ncbi:MAG: hypothetical protein IKU48_04615 [Clostridia bacterium]|nr:hypothetical protein [Clostridia bacterium]